MVLTVSEAKKLTVPRLKEELTKRGLDSAGNKPELLARLSESIEKAEAAILDDALIDNISGVHDDILNDDLLLDAPSVDGDADPLLNRQDSSVSDVKDEPKVVSTKKEERKSTDDAKLNRAARFGLPIVGTAAALGSNDAKLSRAQRFGVNSNPTLLASDEAKAKRAERFGITSSEQTTNDKRAERAARFGIPMNENNKRKSAGLTDEEKEKLAARAKRFGGAVADDSEVEAKKQARLARFSNA